ncbi:TRAF-type zinc finger [Seminavis robusta]|uniref:TRAF-type zinc finger n=1 Tax=Seminavis robusta TaxID=568900 RepID=A0A9N8DJF1_9STRA|nr:TRAF-type zinc finger [Seminavis robusta]|eukprot:Sro161_g072360.1 TRAF-type zinc finger (490) ;mRNA; f:10452-11921
MGILSFVDIDTVSKVTTSVQIHENQRYWIGRGWNRSLMPTDRGCYSTLDGSQSWKTLEEAAEALLGGSTWKWKQDECPFHEGDWKYARDFSVQAVNDAKPKRGPLHWVRYRVLQRPAVFVPESISTESVHDKHEVEGEPIEQGCRNCDSKAVRDLARVLLEVLAFVAIISTPKASATTGSDADAVSSNVLATVKDTTLLRIKSELVEFLLKNSIPSAASTGDGDTNEQDSFYQLHKLHQSLQKFADDQVAKYKSSNILRAVLVSTPKFETRDTTIPLLKPFSQSISERCFTANERTAMAFCTVKRLDRPHFQLQCHSLLACKDDKCEFRWVACSNEGCKEIMSRLYLDSHVETECPYKRITCECGDEFAKYQQLRHLQEVCPLREASCPFQQLGCTKVLRAKDIPEHVQKDTSSHLLLALSRMKEHENQIRQLQQSQKALEGQTIHNQNQHKELLLQLQKIQKQMSALQSTTGRDIQRLKDETGRSHVK